MPSQNTFGIAATINQQQSYISDRIAELLEDSGSIFDFPIISIPSSPEIPTFPEEFGIFESSPASNPTVPVEPRTPATEITSTSNPALTLVPSVNPDITFADSYDLGNIVDNVSITESVGGSDLGDGYEFTVTQAGEYRFTLDGLSADVDLLIFDSQGEVLTSSINAGNEAEVIEINLNQGTYYAGVESYDEAPTEYILDIASSVSANPLAHSTGNSGSSPTVEPISTSSDSRESFDTALDLGTIQGNYVYIDSDRVGGDDSADLYRFDVTESTQASIRIDGLSADVDLYLVNSVGDTIASSTNSGTQGEIIEDTIAADEYYLGVVSHDDIDTGYNLGISFGNSQVSFLTADLTDDVMALTEDSTLV